MKKFLICSVVFILVTIIYIAGYKKGRETGLEIGFQAGWEGCERDATVDWGEWR